MFAQDQQTLDKPLALYRRMLTFWQLHLSVGDPDLRQLADIHKLFAGWSSIFIRSSWTNASPT